MNELIFFIVLILTAGAVTWIYYPKNTVKQYWLKSRNSSNRALTEDALKHLFDFEERELTGTTDSLAGCLSITRDRAAVLMAKLKENKLVENERVGVYRLTDAGRLYALKIIRTHRLWERYLADETGADQMSWHSLAEEKEHELTVEEVDALAAKLGNPMYDPHGDPIPLNTGEIPKRKGSPLPKLPAFDVGRIEHIEDEPEILYAQIVALGLYPGMHIRMLSSDEERVRFEANGEECILSPQIANSISVSTLEFNEVVPVEYITLANLKEGEKCKVVGLAKALRGQQRRRLMDLGIVPGSIIESKFSSASGNPTAFLVRGALIGLRKEHAALIYVEMVNEEVENVRS